MRGVETRIQEIRHAIFTEVAKMAYDVDSPVEKTIEEIPYRVIPGEVGNFRNDVYGNYIRYTHSSCHSYVVMSIGGKILVVNGENDQETKEIYHNISEKK